MGGFNEGVIEIVVDEENINLEVEVSEYVEIILDIVMGFIFVYFKFFVFIIRFYFFNLFVE